MSEGIPQEFKSILVATDFSDTAHAGFQWAVELARVHDAEIRLVHGLMLPSQATDFLPSPPDYSEEIQAAALARLDRAANEAREKGCDVETDLRLGMPSQCIMDAAEEDGADLIVIGTRGLTGLSHLLLGSTAQRVVQHAKCPVLAIHPGDIDQHRKMKSILVPTDFSDHAARAIHIALEILDKEPDETRLVLLHVYHLPFEYTAYGTVPTAVDYFQDVEGNAQQRLEEIAAPLRKQGLEIKTVAREGYPPEVIVAVADELKTDLIAVGTHGRSGLAHLLLGSTAERVMQTAPCPVLTVRLPDED